MTGTIIVTGANGSLALEFVKLLLTHAPTHNLILTVRNPSPGSDQNTEKLERILKTHANAKVSVEALDLASLAAVRIFADSVSQRIAKDILPPVSAVVCNAFTWSLHGQKLTSDGYEASFQVTYLAQYLLVLKLLGSMAPDGRVVLLGSTAHYPLDERHNPMTKLSAEFPEEINNLVRPQPDEPGNGHDRGFQRYGNAKLAVVMFMHELNRRLEADPKLSNITVTAMDPGGLIDSRAHTEQDTYVRVIFSVMNALMPLLKRMTKEVRKSSDAAVDLLALTIGTDFKGGRGYYVGQMPSAPAKASMDTQNQQALWKASWSWVGLKDGDTVLTSDP